MIKIFRGGGVVVDGEGVAVKMLVVGWWWWGVIKESLQKHLKTGGG